LCLLIAVGAGCGSDKQHDLPAILEVWDFSDPAGSQTQFERLAEQAAEAGAPIYAAELLTQVARCQGLQGQFEAAHATLDSVSTLAQANRPRVRLRIALERGRVLNSSREPEAAKPLFVEAWGIGRDAGEDYLACDAAHMVAIVGSLPEAEGWTDRARQLALESKDERVRHWLGPLSNNLGWSYFDAERYPEALGQFEMSLRAFLKEPDTEVRQLIARYAIGKTLRAMGENSEAVGIQEKLRLAFAARGEEDGYVFEELAEGYSALGQTEESCQAAQDAARILGADPWFVENEPERLERLRELGATCG
jgi:tetratricopeptide (TPR) repeat protein